MVIKPSKAKVVHFRHPRTAICQTAFSCGGAHIQCTDCYKYLEIEFTEYLSWANVIESTSIRVNKAASYLIAKMRCSGALVCLFSLYVHMHLCNTPILPIIEYGSFI